MLRLKSLLGTPAGLMLLAIVLGLCNAAILLGWSVVNPLNISWLIGDNASHHLGWAFYRYQSPVTFPLTWTDRIGYPAGTSIALIDSVPLVALLFRPLSAVLPEPFQYLGLYASLCFVLQAYFGFRLCARLFPGHLLVILLGGMFFLLSPPLTWQVFGHFPHLGHWLVLAGLDSYFRDTESPLKWISRHWGVLALSAGVNPYIAAQCFFIAMAAVGRLLLERRCSWRMGGALLVLTPAVLFASLLFFGVLVERSPGTYWAPGYGELSLNLLAPINPMVFGSIVLPALPVTNPGQFEGYNYLGLGIIALLVVNLARRPRSFAWLLDRRLLPLVGLALVCTATAASTRVTVGSLTLLDLDLPRSVGALVEGLRVSGRLFWPVHYLLVAAALSLTFWHVKPRYRVPILAAALVLQAADLKTLRSSVRTTIDQSIADPLRSREWQELGRTHDNLIVLPAFQCAPLLAPAGYQSFLVFGKLAAAQRMRTNSYYAARYTRDEMRVHCVDLPGTVLTGVMDARSAYVVTDGIKTVLDVSPMTSHRCMKLDGFNLCTSRGVQNAESARAIPDAFPYAIGDELDFGAGGNAGNYMTYGWAAPSGDGAWTEGPLAKLLLGQQAPLDGNISLTLVADVRAFVTRRHHRLDVDVVINGQTLDRWTFRDGRPVKERRVRIPGALVAGRPFIDVEFRLLNPQAPFYVGEGCRCPFHRYEHA